MLSYLFILLTCAIINIWGWKVQTSVFCEAFFPITWIKPRAAVTKYNGYIRSHATCDITMPQTVWMVHLCKNYHFQNKANCQTFLVKRSSVCMRIKKIILMSMASYLVSLWNRVLLQLGNDLPAKSIQQSDIAARNDPLHYIWKLHHSVPR